mgnify:CR=1 FL=1
MTSMLLHRIIYYVAQFALSAMLADDPGCRPCHMGAVPMQNVVGAVLERCWCDAQCSAVLLDCSSEEHHPPGPAQGRGMVTSRGYSP